MRIILFLIAIFALLGSLGSCAMSKSAVHEIQASVSFLIFVVALAGAALLEEAARIRKAVEGAKPKAEPVKGGPMDLGVPKT